MPGVHMHPRDCLPVKFTSKSQASLLCTAQGVWITHWVPCYLFERSSHILRVSSWITSAVCFHQPWSQNNINEEQSQGWERQVVDSVFKELVISGKSYLCSQVQVFTTDTAPFTQLHLRPSPSGAFWAVISLPVIHERWQGFLHIGGETQNPNDSAAISEVPEHTLSCT